MRRGAQCSAVSCRCCRRSASPTPMPACAAASCRARCCRPSVSACRSRCRCSSLAMLADRRLHRARRVRRAQLGLLIVAGIIHFAWGRYCNYRATKAIGANLVAPVQQYSLILTLVLAVLLARRAADRAAHHRHRAGRRRSGADPEARAEARRRSAAGDARARRHSRRPMPKAISMRSCRRSASG